MQSRAKLIQGFCCVREAVPIHLLHLPRFVGIEQEVAAGSLYIIEAVAQSYEFWFHPLSPSDDPIVLARQTLP